MSEWSERAGGFMDSILDKLKRGESLFDDPKLEELCKKVVKYQEENPITDIKAWAHKLAQESSKFND